MNRNYSQVRKVIRGGERTYLTLLLLHKPFFKYRRFYFTYNDTFRDGQKQIHGKPVTQPDIYVLNRFAGDDKLTIGTEEKPIIQLFTKHIQCTVYRMFFTVKSIGYYLLFSSIKSKKCLLPEADKTYRQALSATSSHRFGFE